jgi:hypothetical protein
MGNINYNNFICENYYCQSISFKPEWLSESTWNITYNYLEEEKTKKPYLIDKGILKINDVKKFELLFSKKLLIDFNLIRNISIPINFKYYMKNNNLIDIFFIFSSKQLEIDDLNQLDTNKNLFFIKINFVGNKINIFRSFNDKIFTKKIKFKKVNTFIMSLENNFKIILVNEKLYNNKSKILYDEKYLNNNSFDDYNDFFLNLYIKSKNGFSKKDFIELNFE